MARARTGDSALDARMNIDSRVPEPPGPPRKPRYGSNTYWANKWDLIHPGTVPTKPPPSLGQRVRFTVRGLPPYKNLNFSLRNKHSPQVREFVRLRLAAEQAMAGRRWWAGAVELNLMIHTNRNLSLDLYLYQGGVFDALDGSHGPSFTFLPILYQDDGQICNSHTCAHLASTNYYTVDAVTIEQPGRR
jgi:hypothetical protein